MICPNCQTDIPLEKGNLPLFCGNCRYPLSPNVTLSNQTVPVMPHIYQLPNTSPPLRSTKNSSENYPGVAPIREPNQSIQISSKNLIVFIALSIIIGVLAGGMIDRYLVMRWTSTPPNDPNFVHYYSGSTPMGIIRHAIITDAYTKQDVSSDTKDMGLSYYHCAARFTVANIPNSQTEIFWDRDYPNIKTNSADIYNECERYKENSGDPEQGKPVTLIVTGTRDPSQSQFRNILFFLPEDQ